MADALSEAIDAKGALTADGAMGTNLFISGLQTGDAPEFWNVEHPSKIIDLHKSFINAGADIILTNSFGGNKFRLKLHEAESRVEELNCRAAELAREAANQSSRDVLVAGSIGPSGELFEPIGPLSIGQGRDAFAQQALALKDGGAQIIWIETMSAIEEVEAAVAGARETGLPLVVTMTYDTNGRTMMGVSPKDAAKWLGDLDDNIIAVGANCGIGPAEALISILDMQEITPHAKFVAKANCGVPEFINGEFRFSGTPEMMGKYARLARDAGAKIVGGCCGSEPIHLTAIAEALQSPPSETVPTTSEIASELGLLSSFDLTADHRKTNAPRKPRRRQRFQTGRE
jgi:5-methyltetrahydrofolate--homocysteine methyltransferase